MILHYEIATRTTFEIERGTHRYDSILIPLCGEFEYHAENVQRVIHPFTPIYFKKGVHFFKKIIQPITCIIVRFSQPINNIDSWLEYDQTDLPRLKDTIERLYKEIVNNAPLHRIEHFVNDIMILSSKTSTQTHDLSAVTEYIHQHFCETIQLKELAAIIGSSQQTLLHKFKERHHTTPIRMITDLRIEKAKHLLLNTDTPICSIADLCGYENIYYFSNTFKKHCGISPRDFRRYALL